MISTQNKYPISPGELCSVEADAHAALSGAARLLEILYRAPLFYGLPSTSLHTALLWNHAGPAKQRLTAHGEPLFPSWSWLGWNGPVTMPRQNCSWRTLSCIKWINPEELKEDQDFRTAKEVNIALAKQLQAENISDTLVWKQCIVDTRHLIIAYFERNHTGFLYDHPIISRRGSLPKTTKASSHDSPRQLSFYAWTAEFEVRPIDQSYLPRPGWHGETAVHMAKTRNDIQSRYRRKTRSPLRLS